MNKIEILLIVCFVGFIVVGNYFRRLWRIERKGTDKLLSIAGFSFTILFAFLGVSCLVFFLLSIFGAIQFPK